MAGDEKLLSRQLRETLDYIRGNYKVVYMAVADSLIGFGVITRGGGRNIFCSSRDIVLRSLFVRPDARGKGYGRMLVQVLATGCGLKHEKVYAYIRPDNDASIKTALANGFAKVGTATYKGLLKRIVLSKNGSVDIYRKDNK